MRGEHPAVAGDNAVLFVEWHPGELYPRVGFIVTNLARPVERLVAFHNHRGTCEQYIWPQRRAEMLWIGGNVAITLVFLLYQKGRDSRIF